MTLSVVNSQDTLNHQLDSPTFTQVADIGKVLTSRIYKITSYDTLSEQRTNFFCATNYVYL